MKQLREKLHGYIDQIEDERLLRVILGFVKRLFEFAEKEED